MKITLWLVIAYSFFIGCTPKKELVNTSTTNLNKSINCNFEERPLFFDITFFANFKTHYDAFLKSDNEFDLFHYFSHGNVEKLERIYYSSNNGWSLLEMTNKNDSTILTITEDAKRKLTEFLSNIDQGSYWQVCRANSSSPYYNIYLFKKNGKDILNYYAESGSYEDLNKDDKLKVKGVIDALEFIKSLYVKDSN